MDQPKLHPCVFILPVLYNDGEEVEAEVLLEVFQALDRQFGGCQKRPIEGSWKGQVEPCLEVTVSVPPGQVEALREVVIQIGRRLKQKAMYLEVRAATAEIIEIENPKEATP